MDVEAHAGAASAIPDDKSKPRSNPPSLEDRSISHGENDILGRETVDHVLAAKMVIINDVS